MSFEVPWAMSSHTNPFPKRLVRDIHQALPRKAAITW